MSRQAPPPWPALGTPSGRCIVWNILTVCCVCVCVCVCVVCVHACVRACVMCVHAYVHVRCVKIDQKDNTYSHTNKLGYRRAQVRVNSEVHICTCTLLQ